MVEDRMIAFAICFLLYVCSLYESLSFTCRRGKVLTGLPIKGALWKASLTAHLNLVGSLPALPPRIAMENVAGSELPNEIAHLVARDASALGSDAVRVHYRHG